LKWYRETHPVLDGTEIKWIQLGSTGIWDVSQDRFFRSALCHSTYRIISIIQGGPTFAEDVKHGKSVYLDRHSPTNPANARANAEKELLSLHSPKETHDLTTILNLCGLYGGSRSIRRYVSRIAGTKELLQAKGSIHMIHGIDVARAIFAITQGASHLFGERWLLTGGLLNQFRRGFITKSNTANLLQICVCMIGMT
jgi:hypothetical protein